MIKNTGLIDQRLLVALSCRIGRAGAAELIRRMDAEISKECAAFADEIEREFGCRPSGAPHD